MDISPLYPVFIPSRQVGFRMRSCEGQAEEEMSLSLPNSRSQWPEPTAHQPQAGPPLEQQG